jgi:hypothetical protein
MTNDDETIAAELKSGSSFVTTLSHLFSRIVHIFQSFSSGNCEPGSINKASLLPCLSQ